MTTSARSPQQVVQSPCNQSYRPHEICRCTPSWRHNVIMMHTWTYRRNEKVHFSLRPNTGKKKLAACLLHNIDIAVVSEPLCHLKAQYLIQPPNICSGKHILLLVHPVSAIGRAFCVLSLRRHTNSFAAVENNFMRFCISLTQI